MTVSRYITEALERAALPIHVSFDPDAGTLFVGRHVDDVFYIAAGSLHLDHADATRAYLDLVSTLETTGSTSPVALAEGCSGPDSPGAM